MSLTAPTPFLIIEADVGPPLNLGDTGTGDRRCIPIVGGRVTGDLTGEVLPGADWQLVHADGALEIEAHYALRTVDGDLIEVESRGVRSGPPEILARLVAGEVVDPADYYFRTAMRFRTSAPALRRLNTRLAVARGQRRSHGVRLEVFEVL